MTENRISLTSALSDAWDRMVGFLFRPFDLAKWFVVGFTAWLAGMASSGSGFGFNLGDDFDSSDSDFSSAAEGVLEWGTWRTWGQWLLDHPAWLIGGVLVCGFLVTLILVILWVSSRGKFMFLDNVAQNRAEVVRPWKRYRRVGNSLFGFQLAFVGVILVVMSGLALVIFSIARRGMDMTLHPPGCAAVGLAVLGFLTLGLAIGYLQYFLDGFVVPLMYRYDLGVLAGWSRFGDLFRRHPWTFLLSGPFLLLLCLVAGLAILVVGLMTCCIGLLLIAIPYIGTVVILPLIVTYRAFTVELLEQIEPGFFAAESLAEDPEPALSG